MKRFVAVSLVALLGSVSLLGPPPAKGADISLESRSYLPASGIDDDGTHVLFYEYLTLAAEDLETTGLYVRAGGWGRADLADETFDRTSNGELQYGFIGLRGPYRNAEARIGRVSVTAGVARNEVVDGALAGMDLPAGFDVTVFGGIPIETQEEGRAKDSLYGARLSQGHDGLYRLGASYLRERNHGDDFREEAGADVIFAPFSLLEIGGSSLYNVIDSAWARHDYRVRFGPLLKRVRLRGTWVSTDYEHYFVSPTNDIFEIDPAEKLDRVGGELEIQLGRGFAVTGEYFSYAYDIAQDAQAYGGRLDWAGGPRSAGVGYRKVHGDDDENRYQFFRAYATAAVLGLQAALGAEHLAYEEPINGKKNATTGTLTLTYGVSRALEISASAEYGDTPEFKRELRGLLVVTWRYHAASTKGGTP